MNTGTHSKSKLNISASQRKFVVQFARKIVELDRRGPSELKEENLDFVRFQESTEGKYCAFTYSWKSDSTNIHVIDCPTNIQHVIGYWNRRTEAGGVFYTPE